MTLKTWTPKWANFEAWWVLQEASKFAGIPRKSSVNNKQSATKSATDLINDESKEKEISGPKAPQTSNKEQPGINLSIQMNETSN